MNKTSTNTKKEKKFRVEEIKKQIFVRITTIWTNIYFY